MSEIQASDLYKELAGGSQRASVWAGIIQEDIEVDRKNPGRLENAYTIEDGARLTNGKLEMYHIESPLLSSPIPSPSPLLSSPIPSPSPTLSQPPSPALDNCPEISAPQWMPYALYNMGDIVKDKCILYTVTLPVTKSEDNIASPEFSKYFTVYSP
jgi:hypothetical protein